MPPAAAVDVVTVAPVPPGKVQNLENPDYIGQKIVVCNAACLTLAGLIVMLRLYTRAFIVRNIGKDDSKYMYISRNNVNTNIWCSCYDFGDGLLLRTDCSFG